PSRHGAIGGGKCERLRVLFLVGQHNGGTHPPLSSHSRLDSLVYPYNMRPFCNVQKLSRKTMEGV
ncbi:hypothetical protein JMJ77_0005284, partial [Colletotrichum scovillei]